MRNKRLLFLTQGALIAAAYAAMTYLSMAFGIAFGPFQLRLSEVLTILPVFTAAAVPGLTLGCLLGNLSSPYGIVDILLGTLATLLAAICTRALRNVRIKDIPFLASLPPVVFNAIIIGAEITFLIGSHGNLTAFLICAGEVALGQFGACCILGLSLFVLLKRRRIGDVLFENKSI